MMTPHVHWSVVWLGWKLNLYYFIGELVFLLIASFSEF